MRIYSLASLFARCLKVDSFPEYRECVRLLYHNNHVIWQSSLNVCNPGSPSSLLPCDAAVSVHKTRTLSTYIIDHLYLFISIDCQLAVCCGQVAVLHRPSKQIQGLVRYKKECYRNYDIDCCQHYTFKPVTSAVMHYQVQNYRCEKKCCKL